MDYDFYMIANDGCDRSLTASRQAFHLARIPQVLYDVGLRISRAHHVLLLI